MKTLKLNNNSLHSALVVESYIVVSAGWGQMFAMLAVKRAKSCPNQRKEREPTRTQPRPNARVYSLSEDDVNAGPSTVVTGQLPVANLSLYSLIDSGATHSFIASKVAEKLEWDRQILSYPFITITPAGDTYESTSWFRNVPI